ncbi:MAG: hypothetical protein ACRDYX_10880 [Egibacteraceae bacterium]
MVSLVAGGNERLVVTATVEVPWADVRFRVADQPVEVRVETADVSGLMRGLLRAAQQLGDAAVVSGAVLGDAGWARAALLVDDALVALVGPGESDG